jgi:hypothetical protein
MIGYALTMQWLSDDPVQAMAGQSDSGCAAVV